MAIKKIFYYILMLTLSISCTDKNKLQHLLCEYQTNPLGLDVPAPRFSWNIGSDERDVYQSAYRIIVSNSKNEIENKIGNMWDSKKVESNNTTNIEYKGEPLESNRTYFWRVCAIVNGKEVWSNTASFHTGFLNQSDWKANWISTKEDLLNESPLFRKGFKIDKNIEEAYVYVATAGFYELYLNDQKVGDHVLDPSITDYRKTVLYSVFDVTDQLRKGKNAFGLMLANGAYNLTKRTGERYAWADGGERLGNPKFMLQLNIKYKDGSSEIITSDDSWKYKQGPITFNNIYGGEDYDARKEIDKWASGELDDSGWNEAVVAQSPGGKLKSQAVPIRVTETLEPIAETNPEKGVYLFDLGQNMAGWWRIEVSGNAGQTIRVRGAESLNNEPPKNLEAADRLTVDRRTGAIWTDYTLKGSENEIYEPRFFYTGFRYIEVTTDDKEDLKSLKVTGRVVRSDLAYNGTWNSSDTLLNKIHQAGVWSQKSNLISYPTDCPHREKGAYTGDGQIIAETSMHDFQMAPFYMKWLNDMRDAQEPNGRIPNTAPTLIGGMGGGIGWGSAYILIPWWMNHYYDDTRILEEHYPTMKKYIQYLHNLARTDENPGEPYIINFFEQFWYSLGEWCSPGMNDCPNHAVVNTFYYYYDTWLMSQIADMLGHKEDARQFTALSDTIKQEFNKKFFNPETNLYGLDSTYQTYQIIALVGNLVPEEHREAVLNTITDDIHARNNHLNTGIIGTKYLWPTLVNAGHNDLAYEVATQETYPGYGFWIKNNSTTLLEHWKSTTGNHQMFGTVTEYFYKYLAGIQSPMEGNTTKGYKHVHIQPYIPEQLDAATASLNTISGKVISDWKKDANGLRISVTIPANTIASLVIPCEGKNITVKESNTVVWENEKYETSVTGVSGIKKEADQLILSLRSGKYNFNITF
ncbi:MAG: family 78 glycoside hydrolase catalytic domain [Bacteroidales bacterium]|nr:family 78 glycoside hydrolase catalytic domain [Bacteroidales bacterium]